MSYSVLEQAAQAVDAARRKNPLTPAVTNVITVDFVVNAQLAVGGSGAVTYLANEMAPLAGTCDAVYINMGSLLPVHKTCVPATLRACAQANTPWVLDPVGIGLGDMRLELYGQMKRFPPDIIRCNASEAIVLAQTWGLACDTHGFVRGVDATDTVAAAGDAAVELAKFTGGAVAVSGGTDLISDGRQIAILEGGSPFFTVITGSGCSLGGVCAVYAAVTNPFAAAIAASAAYAVAGARAEAQAAGPASFKVAFLDELYHITPDDIRTSDITFKEA